MCAVHHVSAIEKSDALRCGSHDLVLQRLGVSRNHCLHGFGRNDDIFAIDIRHILERNAVPAGIANALGKRRIEDVIDADTPVNGKLARKLLLVQIGVQHVSSGPAA